MGLVQIKDIGEAVSTSTRARVIRLLNLHKDDSFFLSTEHNIRNMASDLGGLENFLHEMIRDYDNSKLVLVEGNINVSYHHKGYFNNISADLENAIIEPFTDEECKKEGIKGIEFRDSREDFSLSFPYNNDGAKNVRGVKSNPHTFSPTGVTEITFNVDYLSSLVARVSPLSNIYAVQFSSGILN